MTGGARDRWLAGELDNVGSTDCDGPGRCVAGGGDGARFVSLEFHHGGLLCASSLLCASLYTSRCRYVEHFY